MVKVTQDSNGCGPTLKTFKSRYYLIRFRNPRPLGVHLYVKSAHRFVHTGIQRDARESNIIAAAPSSHVTALVLKIRNACCSPASIKTPKTDSAGQPTPTSKMTTAGKDLSSRAQDPETFAKRPLLPPATAGCQTQILTRLRRINPQNTQCMDACPDLIGVVNPPEADRLP